MRSSIHVYFLLLFLMVLILPLSLSAHMQLEIEGTFLKDPGIRAIKFGVAKAHKAQQVLAEIPISDKQFKYNIEVLGLETYFLKHNQNVVFFDLGPGTAKITLSDSSLVVNTIVGNSGYDDLVNYINRLRTDTNFTNGRKARVALDDYRSGKTLDSLILRQKENAYETMELISTKTELAFSKQVFERNPESWANSQILFKLLKDLPEDYIKSVFKKCRNHESKIVGQRLRLTG